jgi:group I intron endonuclease
MTSGIYKIVNEVNGKCYVGSSKNIKRRMHDHFISLTNGKHRNARLQNSWDRHGRDNFTFETILICEQSDLEMYEQIIMDGFDAYFKNGGFNLRPMAFVNKGRPGSEKQKQATRNRLIGVKNPKLSQLLLTPERQALSRQKLNSFRYDPRIEEKRRAAIRKALNTPENLAAFSRQSLGKKRSPEAIEKMRIAARRRHVRWKAEGRVRLHGPDGRLCGRMVQQGGGQPGNMSQ